MGTVWIILGAVLLLFSISQIQGAYITAKTRGTIHEETILNFIYVPFITGTSLCVSQNPWMFLLAPAGALLAFILVISLSSLFPALTENMHLGMFVVSSLYLTYSALAGAGIGFLISKNYFDSEYTLILAIASSILAFTYCFVSRAYVYR